MEFKEERRIRLMTVTNIYGVSRVLALLPSDSLIIKCSYYEAVNALDFLIESQSFPNIKYRIINDIVYYETSGFIREDNNKILLVLTDPDGKEIYRKMEV